MSPTGDYPQIYEMGDGIMSSQAEEEEEKKLPFYNLESALNQVSFVLFGTGMLVG